MVGNPQPSAAHDINPKCQRGRGGYSLPRSHFGLVSCEQGGLRGVMVNPGGLPKEFDNSGRGGQWFYTGGCKQKSLARSASEGGAERI